MIGCDRFPSRIAVKKKEMFNIILVPISSVIKRAPYFINVSCDECIEIINEICPAF